MRKSKRVRESEREFYWDCLGEFSWCLRCFFWVVYFSLLLLLYLFIFGDVLCVFVLFYSRCGFVVLVWVSVNCGVIGFVGI